MTDLPLLGRGRAADVFDLGNGRVLRRYRTPHPGVVEREALAMRHLHAHGVPVPQVFSADGDEMVMERLDGMSMLDVIKRRPWQARSIGRQLAELQRRIHGVPAGDLAIPRFSDGDAILHFDLHPDNVMLTARGPVVIDWSNVAIGDPHADVAFSWMLMSTAEPDHVPLPLRPVLRFIRRNLVRGFTADMDGAAQSWVARVCERRLADPNTTAAEAANIERFAATPAGR
jgi:aminoglycoside phosphotransferase (APT) family kinase protein